VAEVLPTLYQAEWCPYSAAVREVLTELGIDFVVRQVEPWPEDRESLRATTGSDWIPVLRTEDGMLFRGTREIFGHLREREPWRFAAAHRRRFADHRDARTSDVPAQLLEYFRGTDDLESAPEAEAGSVERAEIVDSPDKSRYELRLDGKLIGIAAYRRRLSRISFTHTEVDESCTGRGFGSRLAKAALDDARRTGLRVLPLCPFIAHYIDTHPEYRDLLASSFRSR
jgi:uncharacterized protein